MCHSLPWLPGRASIRSPVYQAAGVSRLAAVRRQEAETESYNCRLNCGLLWHMIPHIWAALLFACISGRQPAAQLQSVTVTVTRDSNSDSGQAGHRHSWHGDSMPPSAAAPAGMAYHTGTLLQLLKLADVIPRDLHVILTKAVIAALNHDCYGIGIPGHTTRAQAAQQCTGKLWRNRW